MYYQFRITLHYSDDDKYQLGDVYLTMEQLPRYLAMLHLNIEERLPRITVDWNTQGSLYLPPFVQRWNG